MEAIKWENGIISIPLNSNLVGALDQAGNENWEPWAVLGADETNVRIAVKRPKRAITVATEMPGSKIN